MDKIGFIGYGSMGSMIIKGILSHKVLKREEMIICTRTRSKLSDLEEEHPEVEIADNNASLADKCQKIFLFVGTGEVKKVIEEIKPKITLNTHIIYISAGLTIKTVESKFPGKITKVIPNITSQVGEGVSLVCHNEKVTPEDVEFINNIFKVISSVKTIKEEDFEVASDLTSCAPAFIAEILNEFTNAAIGNSEISKEDAEEMVIKTLYGTSKLLIKGGMDFDEIISRVATKGGITEQGIKVLDEKLPAMFDQLLKTTQKKHETRKKELNEIWANEM